MNGWIRIRPGGLAEVLGIEQPPAEVVAWTSDFIALKVPGRKYWRMRGGTDGYARSEFQIFRLDVPDHTKPGVIPTEFKATCVLTFPVTKGTK